MKMNIRTIFGLVAVAALLAVAAPTDRAQAVSLINPAVSTSAKLASDKVTEVHWRGHHRWHRHHGWGRHHGWRRHHWHHRHHWHRRHHWY